MQHFLLKCEKTGEIRRAYENEVSLSSVPSDPLARCAFILGCTVGTNRPTANMDAKSVRFVAKLWSLRNEALTDHGHCDR